jgi:hypothetical protein
MPDLTRITRIIVRVVKSPVAERGHVLVVLPESRSPGTRDVIAYRFDGTVLALVIDSLRHLMDCSRAANPHMAADARQQFEYWYGEPVQLTTKANPHQADEPPADDDDDQS